MTLHCSRALEPAICDTIGSGRIAAIRGARNFRNWILYTNDYVYTREWHVTCYIIFLLIEMLNYLHDRTWKFPLSHTHTDKSYLSSIIPSHRTYHPKHLDSHHMQPSNHRVRDSSAIKLHPRARIHCATHTFDDPYARVYVTNTHSARGNVSVVYLI